MNSPYVNVIKLEDKINLDLIFTSGQTFRWIRTDKNVWTGVIGSRVIYLKQISDNSISWHCPNDPCVDPLILRRYLHLDQNLSELEKSWHFNDPQIGKKVKFGKGLRLLRQEFIETLFSFICSSNNNIKRISKMVRFLATNYGKFLYKCDEHGLDFYSFPTIDELYCKIDVILADLTKFGFGYRAKYIFKTVKFLAENWTGDDLSSFTSLSYNEQLARLLKLTGVGQKVADCIILMSCDKFNVIPIDVHMFKMAQRDFASLSKYKTLSPLAYRTIANYLQQKYGDYAGWAQLILFASELKE